jgi:hypothetical protein
MDFEIFDFKQDISHFIYSLCSCKKQCTVWVLLIRVRAGLWVSQTPAITCSQRVWNGQPPGRSNGLGMSPLIAVNRSPR